MDPLLAPLVHSPLLPKYVKELERFMADEAIALEQFYEWLDEDKKAEFINGRIILHSPAKYEHVIVQKLILKLLDTYVERHQLGTVLYEKAVVKLSRNAYEPDICFWTSQTSATFTAKQMIYPPPDLVVEVLSPSTEVDDRGVKFDDYATNGVVEYWIVDPDARVIEQYDLSGTTYKLRTKLLNRGDLRSKAVAGFRVDAKAAFDAAANLAALKKLLA